MPVELDVRVDSRLSVPVEVGIYYVVSEMLANAEKHARASVVESLAGHGSGAGNGPAGQAPHVAQAREVMLHLPCGAVGVPEFQVAQ